MNLPLAFTVPIERVLRSCATAMLSVLITLVLAFVCAPTVRAASVGSSKIATDLQLVIALPVTPKLSWAKDVGGLRYVKALVVSNGDDPELAALRADILARGGSVYMRYVSVSALSVMLPANQVAAIAARSDVQGISPNRLTARTASTLEYSTGVMSLRSYTGGGYSGLDGAGVGIAVVDSGIMFDHLNMADAVGKSRVKRAVDFQKVGDATAMGVKDWTIGVDTSSAMYPGSPTLATYESKIANNQVNMADKYGHGTHVASVAAGRGAYQATDSSGVAPGADLYDLKVLDANGFGQMSDVIAAIDWVIFHAREYNIRVMNLSLAADSTETWQTDPLARAARSAVAAGITVVVAAGNFGKDSLGFERYGSVSSPAHDPSVITVGSVNSKDTAARNDDVVNQFSSRGPTRGAYLDVNGVRRLDNLLKPDLVAPGNRIVGALESDKAGGILAYLAKTYPALQRGSVAKSNVGKMLMALSGTSISAPAVSGTVALMLQANPGLTPPMVKAMLQYSAQPIAGANLLQQGAGLLNVDGAVRLAQSLRSDVKSSVEAGTITSGASLLAAGKQLPVPASTINGTAFNWGRIVYVGGNQIASGEALFTKFQPIYDHRLVWARDAVRRHVVTYWPAAAGVSANTFVRSIIATPAANQSLLTPGVLQATTLAGSSSWIGKTGAFIPTATLSGWLVNGGGLVLADGILVSEGVVISERVVLSEGLLVSEGVIVSERVILSEGLVLSEGVVISEAGQTGVSMSNDTSLLGEP